MPIRSFRCNNTQALFSGKTPGRFRQFASVAERKLQMLD
ncbi:MAG: hypothetical protein RIR00_990, partial [Pseudomonadota bacterium]